MLERLRLRLYSVDTATGLPFEDLLLTDNIVYPEQLRHINKFSVKAKNIRMPDEGVFVSMEWLPGNDIIPDEKQPYVLGNLYADKGYMYLNFKDRYWTADPELAFSGEGYRVPNISIKVSY